jgi:hypothetical protein
MVQKGVRGIDRNYALEVKTFHEAGALVVNPETNLKKEKCGERNNKEKDDGEEGKL